MYYALSLQVDHDFPHRTLGDYTVNIVPAVLVQHQLCQLDSTCGNNLYVVINLLPRFCVSAKPCKTRDKSQYYRRQHLRIDSDMSSKTFYSISPR